LKRVVRDGEAVGFESDEDKDDYFDNLTIEDIKRMKEAYNEFPRVSVKKKFKVKIDDEDIEIETDFGDMASNFFVR